MATAPLAYEWDGEAFKPLRHCVKMADKEFVIGEVYRLAIYEERSVSTHNHEFAWLKEAWQNLPEGIADLYPTPEHLRKRALIEAGIYDEDVIDAGSNAAALRVASYLRGKDDFSLVIVRGPIVVVRTAKSQSRRAMNRQEFQASKSAIMEVVAHLVGVSPSSLERAGRAA
jgi:hypothetical protein